MTNIDPAGSFAFARVRIILRKWKAIEQLPCRFSLFLGVFVLRYIVVLDGVNNIQVLHPLSTVLLFVRLLGCTGLYRKNSCPFCTGRYPYWSTGIVLVEKRRKAKIGIFRLFMNL